MKNRARVTLSILAASIGILALVISASLEALSTQVDDQANIGIGRYIPSHHCLKNSKTEDCRPDIVQILTVEARDTVSVVLITVALFAAAGMIVLAVSAARQIQRETDAAERGKQIFSVTLWALRALFSISVAVGVAIIHSIGG